ncbi:MAG: folC [Parachlamydiales bacterium]|nr:folC [Parachlamydiales bacterium]
MIGQDLVHRIFSYAVRGKSANSLDRMRCIDEWQGHRHRRFVSIHVAGTNGKGSVSLKIATALKAAGRNVGLYTSPHISTYRERIQVNGSMISEEFVEHYLPKLFAFIDKEGVQPSFFELLTALAFEYFASQHIDIAVLEVGLGGMYDSTNVIDPKLCVITSISPDHMDILGPTLETIARAKAGIIKKGVPVVLGPRACLAPILEAAKGNLIVAPAASAFYDDENNAIARTALEKLGIPEPAIQVGLACRPPCRFEIVDPRPIILDAAHNLDGFAHLRAALDAKYPNVRFHMALALGKGKDPALFMAAMSGAVSRIGCVSNGHSRLMGADELLGRLQTKGFSNAYLAQSLDEVLQTSDPLVVCGSFFILNDVRRALGIQVPTDPCVFTPGR